MQAYPIEDILGALPVGVYVCAAPGGEIRGWNQRAVEIWGREPARGESEAHFGAALRLRGADGQLLPHGATPMAEVLRDGRAREAELAIERPDGTRVDLRVNIAPLRDPDGRLIGAVNAFQDVTLERRAADALRLSEARYRAIVEDQPDLVCRFLSDGTLTFVNDAYCRYFGFVREKTLGKPYPPIVHPDDLPMVQAGLESLSPDNPVVYIENRVFRHDGAIRWTEWTNRALYDERKQLIELQSTGRDITAQKQAEQALQGHLRTVEQLYYLADTIGRARGVADVCEAAAEATVQVAQVSGAAILVADEAGGWRVRASKGLSPALEAALHGFSPWPADVPDPEPVVISDTPSIGAPSALMKAMAGSGVRAMAFLPLAYHQRRLGVLTLCRDLPEGFSPHDLRIAGTIAHHVAFGVARAQTDDAIAAALSRERAARAEADAARADAERANAAKDEFLAMLAHELRNPLGVVAAALSVLEGTDPSDERHARSRSIIRRQTEHLSRLLDDLLDVARITQGHVRLQRSPVDLRTVVSQAIDSHRFRLEAKRQCLTVTLPETSATTLGDQVRLQQVLGNLLENASKYTPAEGRVDVVLEHAGDRAVVRVRDNGPGIARDRLEWIFDLFTQVAPTFARSEGGLGIGLTVARRLVELHGGRIHARSDGPGCGAEFTVELPLHGAAPEGERAGDAPTASARRILVVEDHEDGLEMLVTALRLGGHAVFAARTGREGIAQALACVPDVVLLDIGLPDMQGYDVAKELRGRLGSDVKLIALTGYGGPLDRERSSQAGFDAHLLKPVDPARLATILEDS